MLATRERRGLKAPLLAPKFGRFIVALRFVVDDERLPVSFEIKDQESPRNKLAAQQKRVLWPQAPLFVAP